MYDASKVVEWKSFTLTNVIYPKEFELTIFCFGKLGDRFGKILAIFSLLPHSIIIAFFTLTIFVRDIHVILFFIGQLLNEFLNFILKKSVKEGRPVQIIGLPNTNDTFGWPSSHSQFMGFFFVYATIIITRRLLKVKPLWFCLFLIISNFISLVLVIYSRIYLLYHFVHQCVHGLLFGGGFAIFWYLLVVNFLEPFIIPILKSKLNTDYLGLCSIYIPQNTNGISRKNK
ncbi:Dolichyldiphosphatase 1 [Blomia tropicalis]|nr:Dolichyldiphosphatase 1 [Blomia tropicalis]